MPVSPNVRARGKGRKPKASSAGTPNPANVRTKPETTRASLYDELTGRIIAELEAGRFPWVQPWGRLEAGGGTAGAGLPRNALTARHYSGVNVLILWGAVIEHGYPSQAWLTFKQARQAGGCVRKGERGTTVVYADRFIPRDRKQETLRGSDPSDCAEKARAVETGGGEGDPGSLRGSDSRRAKTIPFLKRFTVFNVAQCEGLSGNPAVRGTGGSLKRPGLAPEPVPLPEREIVRQAEEMIAASGIDFRVGGNRAFYVPAQDYVQVPPQPAFFEQINYYRTCLHELCHGTGHPTRLNRNLAGSFGSKEYAREELIAEMGSAFLCAALGIVPTVRHADYIGSWLDVLREDNRAIFRAASAASKAADWLLARHAEARAEAAQGDTGERRATTPKVPAMHSIVGMAEEGAEPPKAPAVRSVAGQEAEG